MNKKPKSNLYGLTTLLDSAIMFFETRKKIIITASTSLLAAMGIYLFLWGTATFGIGIRTDSVAYLWSARDLAHGIGLGTLDAFGKFKPLNHFPPLYPVLLALFEVCKIDPTDGARWLGSVFIGLLVVLFVVILYRLTNRSFWFSTLGALVLLFMPALWNTSLYAMTEPLYLTCSLTGMICLDNYSTTNRRRWLLLAAVLFTLSFLTRYIGISVITAGLFFLVIKNKLGVRRKLEDLLVLGGIGVVPMAVWLLRNELLTGSSTNRSLHYVAISAQEWQSTFSSLMTWVEPIRSSIKVTLPHLVIFAVALGFAFLIFREKAISSQRTVTHLPGLLTLYAVTYLLLTVESRLLIDRTIPLYEDRILYPFLAAIFFLVLYGLHLLLDYLRGLSRLLAIFMAGFLVITAWSFIRTISMTTFPYVLPIHESQSSGLGLHFRPSDMAFQNAVTQMPEGTLFFTDNVEKLYFYTGKPSSYVGGLTPADIETLRGQLSTKGMVAVVFIDTEPEKQRVLIDQLPQFHQVFTDDSGTAVYLGTRIP